MLDGERFWLVVNIDNTFIAGRGEFLERSPRFVHETKLSAEHESLRLAKVTGQRFAVVESVAHTKPTLPGEYKLIDYPEDLLEVV